MNKPSRLAIWGAALPTVAVLAATYAAPAGAATVTFNFGTVFTTGAVAPDGPAPYATAVFDDGDGTGTVQLTLTSSGSVGIADLTQAYFNLDPTLDPTLLSFAYNIGSSTGPEAFGGGNNGVFTGVDAFQSGGGGLYDILFDFPTDAASTFDVGERVVYTITSPDAITAGSFNFLSTFGGGAGNHLAATKWQSTGPSGLDSAWVGASAIPVPAAVWLFGSGLIGLVGVARRKVAA